MTEELKPCPFCGNFPRKPYVDTLCCNNKTCPIFDYPLKTSDWNTRAAPMSEAELEREAENLSVISRTNGVTLIMIKNMFVELAKKYRG